jgi:hypothetical protein
MYSGNKKVSFGDKSIIVEDANGKQIGLASLSSGEKHLIELFVEILLGRESSILIDEPEISIHVDWQRELAITSGEWVARMNCTSGFKVRKAATKM